MNRILRNSLNIAKILFRSYCTYDGIFCWFVNKHEQWKGFSCWTTCVCGGGGGGTYSEETIERVKWNLVFMFLSMLILWCRLEMTDSRAHGLHINYGKDRLIFFRTNEETLTRFGRTFPNEVWHSSHMTSDILMVNIFEDFFLNNILRVLNEFCNTCIH
jgi:hypothetical protein